MVSRLLLLLVAGLLFWVSWEEGFFEEEVHYVFMVLCVLGGIITTVLLIASSLIQERKSKTFGLLLATAYHPVGILIGKYLMVLGRLTPWIAAFVALWLTAQLDPRARDTLLIHLTGSRVDNLWAVPLRYALVITWFTGAWMVLMGICSTAVLLVRPRGAWLALSVALIGIFVWLGFQTMALGILFDLLSSRDLFQVYLNLLCPFLDMKFHTTVRPQAELFFSAFLWTTGAILVHGVLLGLLYKGPQRYRSILRET